ncbi:MAG: 23S rRNA (guanosine(2251)-2'-O)-methyltransferase RlmB [Gammaproteobacteria bacterium]
MTATKIFGLHAVQAALEYSPQKIRQAWLDSQRRDQRLNAIADTLQSLGIPLHTADKRQLERFAAGKSHQGVVVELEMPAARSEDELNQAMQVLNDPALFLVLDHVQDPHNLGACLRSVDAAGAHGVIVTKDQAAGITPTVCKVASGAAESVPVYQVTNLARTLRRMKDAGLWVIGADGEARQTVYQTDLTVPAALVIGAEGSGMRRLTRETCDVVVKLPLFGQVESLNLSVAAGVLLYEAIRQRLAK